MTTNIATYAAGLTYSGAGNVTIREQDIQNHHQSELWKIALPLLEDPAID